MDLIQPVVIADSGAFTRASTATYFNASGVITTAAVNEPRFNSSPGYFTPATGWSGGLSLLLPSAPVSGSSVTAASRGALFEAAATNLVMQSQAFDTTWTKVASTVSANASVAPDATTTADRIVPNASSVALHGASQMASAALAPGASVGASVFLKAAGYNTAVLRCAPSGQAAGFQIAVNLAAGAITASSAFGSGAVLDDARLAVLPGGWFRLELEGSVAGVTTYGMFVYVGDATTAFAGNTVSGVDAWGAQLELGGVSSYIPTAAAAATRAADIGIPTLVSSVAESEAIWLAGTTYAEGATVRGTGAHAHSIFLSLVGSNTGNAVTDTTKWLKVGPSNRWRMFDESVGSQTIAPDRISVILTAQERVDSIALFNVEAAELRLTMTDAVDGLVFDQTYGLTSDSGISDWYGFFYTDIERITKKVIADLPPYRGAQIEVELSHPGFTVRCGTLVIGRSRRIGVSQYGAGLGIQDYSRKYRDEFGNYSVSERSFNNNATFAVMVEQRGVDKVFGILSKLRATPIVYVGSEIYGSTTVYGYFKDFNIVIAYPSHSLLSLELEGLT
ncbi:hypothetical protein [Phenylobacterium sp.]|uniref:phage head spike fiber domain-containing protein n=1 Tax=Phenylobacterium sp. TaxID=1871053 RepID=UPI002733D855|nr:hypothetical protein [Phenylobacterium sp.]MDP3854656.1 hypothetical protein [Phenylobacterium sp.]